jgi:hypothetical protein
VDALARTRKERIPTEPGMRLAARFFEVKYINPVAAINDALVCFRARRLTAGGAASCPGLGDRGGTSAVCAAGLPMLTECSFGSNS